MAPNLQTDWLLVFVGVVLWWVSCVVVLVCSGLLRGSPVEDVTQGCLGLGARNPCESTPGWSCAVTTDGQDVMSHKRAPGPALGPGVRT